MRTRRPGEHDRPPFCPCSPWTAENVDIGSVIGQAVGGEAHLDRALSGIDEPGVGFYLPEIYRLRGECLLALGRDNKDEAWSAFMTACDLANRQGAVLLERRAAASLSVLATSG